MLTSKTVASLCPQISLAGLLVPSPYSSIGRPPLGTPPGRCADRLSTPECKRGSSSTRTRLLTFEIHGLEGRLTFGDPFQHSGVGGFRTRESRLGRCCFSGGFISVNVLVNQLWRNGNCFCSHATALDLTVLRLRLP